jgi:hypothetical protein
MLGEIFSPQKAWEVYSTLIVRLSLAGHRCVLLKTTSYGFADRGKRL